MSTKAALRLARKTARKVARRHPHPRRQQAKVYRIQDGANDLGVSSGGVEHREGKTDAVGAGFVASLPRPGGNIIGFIHTDAGLGGKCLGPLKEIAPGIKRAGIIFNPDTAPAGGRFLLELVRDRRQNASSRAGRFTVSETGLGSGVLTRRLEKSTNDRIMIQGRSKSEPRILSFGHCHTAFLTNVRLQSRKSVGFGDRSRKPHRIAATRAG